MKNPGILVIGQGLAGTVLSISLLSRGIKHMVLDNYHHGAATHAAAGIINPITGKRFVKSWMVDQLIPYAHKFYKSAASLLDIEIVKSPEIIRSLNSIADENNWSAATDRPEYKTYAEDTDSAGDYTGIVKESLSYGLIRQGMQVNISALITAYQKYLEAENMIIYSKLEHNQIDWQENALSISDMKFDQVVFCEGHGVDHNPLFNTLPFQPSKGEAFIIEIGAFNTQDILRDNIFLVPFGKNKFWSGGGYKWEEENDMPTTAFNEQWRSKLNDLLLKPYHVVDHKAGIRPTVRDRRPIIGRHPSLPHVYIFNGMGTKGTSLAPYWADKFLDFLLEEKPLDDQVNLNRFLK